MYKHVVDKVGRVLRTNDVVITPECVQKRYGNFYVSSLWGHLERKPYQSASERYVREKAVIKSLKDSGLNVPELLAEDDKTRMLTWRSHELSDLVGVLDSKSVHRDDKLRYIQEALALLRSMHNLGHSHGDPYMKNFFVLESPSQGQGNIYTCDFEFRRSVPDEQFYDVLLFVASSMHLLNSNGFDNSPVLDILTEVCGRITGFPFEARDHIFFRTRFGMPENFFDFFE